MNAILKSSAVPTAIGTAWEGGFYAGLITFGGDVYAQVVAPKALGQLADTHEWGKYGIEIAGAASFFDGASNTRAMAESGLVIAERVLELRIAGFDDWHIPARDQLELAYRGFKPTSEENWVYRNGDNPSSLPPGYPYAIHLPGQTLVELFREGGAEAFDEAWYWSSTQCSACHAWDQHFDVGCQYISLKSVSVRVRAFRSIKI
ncbi:DUF1566 domain-containing protein [Burkholderia lata]|uniref:DUF1566 domain-containing protein n=1 Tax=Burkholderia lata (strain ATCC 17760 / DSM 23089 / LMG 22485 / NCIMB 9086 / R18194 / 383) TaxID=482957 RepID=A0A6P2GU87_BURL3|nr:DUF1566 domain-containing protein [Burkholderia lata]VWB08008.1 hypothetical protein BLA6863_00196 [Burkholderia lata]